MSSIPCPRNSPATFLRASEDVDGVGGKYGAVAETETADSQTEPPRWRNTSGALF